MTLLLGARKILPVIIFMVGAPLCIFLHECGHYFAAIAFGCKAQLFAMHTTFTGTFENQQAADSAILLITIAGPMVQVISLAVGAGYLWFSVLRTSDSQAKTSTRFWVASLLTFSGLRWLAGIFRGRTTDEAEISELLGYSWFVLPSALFIVSLATLYFLYRVHRKTQSILPCLFTIAAGITGAALWASPIGPAILGG